MNSITLKRDEWGYYDTQNDADNSSSLITIALIAGDVANDLSFFIKELQQNINISTEMCVLATTGNLITLTDYFAKKINEQLVQLTITRENLIEVLKTWDHLAKQKVDEIILTQHDDGKVTIEGK